MHSRVSRFIPRAKCRIQITDEQMSAIHEKRCTSLIIKQGERPLREGDKLTLTCPMGYGDDVIIRHIESGSLAIREGYAVISVIPEDMIPFDGWHLIRKLRVENDILKAEAARSTGGLASVG